MPALNKTAKFKICELYLLFILYCTKKSKNTPRYQYDIGIIVYLTNNGGTPKISIVKNSSAIRILVLEIDIN